MNRTVFAITIVSMLGVVFFAMWVGWLALGRRDANVRTAASAPAGALIAEFARALYISTTPVNEPMNRVAVPGLRYRGYATIEVREHGVMIKVRGEQPVHIAAGQLLGSGTAARRIGKAVEPGGLGLLRWVSTNTRVGSNDQHSQESVGVCRPYPELESSFRFAHASEQRRFAEAVDQVATASDEPGQER